MKKRMTAILLTIAMLCALLPAAVLPASADVVLPPDEFGENTVSGTCGENLTWTLDLDTGAMSIDGTGEMTEYGDYSSEIPWNDYRDNIRSLVVGDGVTSISGNTFFRCEALTDVTVGSSVERIGYYAFGYSPALASVSLPDSLRIIEEGAFSDCTALCSINLPDGVTSIGTGAFQSCPLTAEELPASLESIGAYAFAYCTELVISSLPANVKTIGAYAFRGCTGLSGVVLPDGVETVGDGAFSGCTSLNSINIPDSVTSIGLFALDGTAFYNNEASWTGDVLYVDNCLIGAKDTISGDCAIREGTSLIADNAFADCKNLTGVTLPDSVTSIGERVFADCKALTALAIPETVTRIGTSAFSGSGLTEIHVPGSVRIIERSVFDHCYSLKRVSIGEGVTSISGGAFQSDSKLIIIALPASLTNVEAWAFNNCDNLKVARFYGTEAQWGAITIGDYNYGLLNADVCFAGGPVITGTCKENLHWTLDTETGVLEIAGECGMCGFDLSTDIAPWYDDRDKIKTIRIDDGVQCIGSEAFRGYTELREIRIAGSVTCISWWAFAECTGLTSVILPNGMTEIGLGAFRGCTGLTSVTIPNTVEYIESGAFLDCTALTDVYYFGTEEEWNAISIEMENECLTGANIHFLGSCEHEHAHPEHKDATCTEAGYDKMICDDCGEVVSEEVIPALGHDLIDHEAKAPTCTEAGWAVYQTCSRCTYTTYAEIPALGHEHAHPEHKDATCTEDGYDRMICDDCGAIISEEVLPALGHDLVIDEAVAPTCTATGLTEGQHCTRCDYKVAQEVVPMLAHSYKYGVCTVCGAKDPDYKPVEPMKFNDVKETAWYYDAVNYAVSNGLMNGVGNNYFAPDDPMTRAMLVTVLWRYESSPKEGTNTFTDVPAGEWYTDAVAWAAANGIVGGVGNGKFDPNGNITREQMAAILYRYAQKKGFDTSAHGDLSGFPDRAKVSEWATDAIVWAVGAGIIGGSDGKLLPQGNATRAQVATILMRFIENIAAK